MAHNAHKHKATSEASQIELLNPYLVVEKENYICGQQHGKTSIRLEVTRNLSEHQLLNYSSKRCTTEKNKNFNPAEHPASCSFVKGFAVWNSSFIYFYTTSTEAQIHAQRVKWKMSANPKPGLFCVCVCMGRGGGEIVLRTLQDIMLRIKGMFHLSDADFNPFLVTGA